MYKKRIPEFAKNLKNVFTMDESEERGWMCYMEDVLEWGEITF